MKLHPEVNRIDQLPAIASEVLAAFPGERIFAFYGELGAGKTTLIKEICRQLGVKEEEMSSPTFALINEYKTGNAEPAYHFDFYRVKNEEEVFDLGYEDYFYSGYYCFIEWPEKTARMLPAKRVNIKITIEGAVRKLHISNEG